jgi:hypothetical protein
MPPGPFQEDIISIRAFTRPLSLPKQTLSGPAAATLGVPVTMIIT